MNLRLHLWLAAACVLLSACQNQSTSLSMSGKALPMAITLPAAPPLAMPTLAGPPAMDFKLLELNEFFPPGASPIWPNPKIVVPMYLTPKGQYPSTEESMSPDQSAVVGSRSEEAYRGLRHWLKLFRKGDTQARSLLFTSTSFDTLWSKDSLGLAISHYVGDNNADVLVVRVRDDRQTRKVQVRPVLEPYFSSALLDSPRFEIAYRWSDGPTLVVRGMGRMAGEPYDMFGYEIAIDSAHPEDPSQMRFIRGYFKAGRPAPAATPASPAP